MDARRERTRKYLRGCAAWASDLHGLGATVVTGLDVELHLLALSKAAEAVGDDARLHSTGHGLKTRTRHVHAITPHLQPTLLQGSAPTDNHCPEEV